MMSLLKFGFIPVSKTATTSSETPEEAEAANHDRVSDTDSCSDSSDIDSVFPAESDSETLSAVTERLSGSGSSLTEYSDTEDDPAIPMPRDPRLRALRIHQGPHQPILSKYKVTVHRGKARSFCSRWYEFHDWLEYSTKVDKIFCFVCRAFAHKVIGSVGRVDPAFTTSGTQASRWKDARKVLSRHQSSSVHKQAALCRKDFETITPINHQLDRVAAVEASRLKEQQERNRQIL